MLYLRKKWQKITPEQKVFFERTELDGLSVIYISKTTGIAINTLLHRKYYAIKYLHKQWIGLYKDLVYNL